VQVEFVFEEGNAVCGDKAKTLCRGAELTTSQIEVDVTASDMSWCTMCP